MINQRLEVTNVGEQCGVGTHCAAIGGSDTSHAVRTLTGARAVAAALADPSR